MGRAYQNRKESMAKTANAKSKVYSKYGREIYVVAKQGGVDPEGNLALRALIDRAKKDQVPAHVVDKAIEKAKGGAGEDYAPAVYEGYGPGNCMVMVECLTDNPNRTIGEVRNCFTKTKSKIGAPGSVSHMFDHCAILVFAGDDEDAVLETLMMADVDVTDIEEDSGKITVFAPHTESHKAKQALLDAFPDLEFDVDEIQYLPQVMTTVSGDDVAVMEKFLDMLNDCDDVQNIYHNAEF
ncbi:transcriptional regulator [Pseudidiomarina salinarum]|uniref:Probable transcriptional regulatory protein IDSA_07270 n=1 Tax=Pseudidiomarina salinarum TaxID=435908 RepID=A0A094IYK0_9GAMM|nr:YebC/PmpR family DNA-binding transcriptional regulator [Pseudidiomarina salinarum]KFZ30869.1 transcriptional regulator [Pseudidiomarina salinarum]RUO71349.1 YebC/PmpR family DNA-binding regulatory protein [Pseudidiomarina salinarum]